MLTHACGNTCDPVSILYLPVFSSCKCYCVRKKCVGCYYAKSNICVIERVKVVYGNMLECKSVLDVIQIGYVLVIKML